MPVKKISDESALNNFIEYTMINSGKLAIYFGFTEDEVLELCNTYNMNFESVREWYDGYYINGHHMYNPNSVYRAMIEGRLDSYWRNTSSFETINTFITMNYEGLKDDVLTMLYGGKVDVDTKTFKNDLNTVSSKNEALTALIHLGYLAYDDDEGSAYIPNYEVATAFKAALATGEWKDIAETISNCDSLLRATINGDAD